MERQSRLSRRHLLGRTGAMIALSPVIGATTVLAEEAPPQPALSIYAKLPAIAKTALSPDGKRVALVSVVDGDIIITDMELSTGKTTTARIENSNAVPVLIWADNESIFVTTSRTDRSLGVRYESWIGYILNVSTGKRYRLYSDMSEYGASLAGDFHRVRIRNAYYITASNFHVTAANYIIDYSTALYAFAHGHRSIRIDEDSRRIVGWAVDGNGRAVARSEYDEDSKLWRLRYRGERGWNVVYTVKCDVDMPTLKGLGRDGKSVLLYLSDDANKDAYVEVLPNGTFGETLKTNRSKYTPLFSPLSNRLIGFASEDGIEDYVFYDPDYAHLPAMIGKIMNHQRVDLIDMAEAPTQVIVFAEGKGDPGTYFAIDFASGECKTIGYTYPDLPAAWVTQKQRINYTAADGLPIEALLTLPQTPANRANRPCALVVLAHGGPESYDDDRFDWMAQALASRGYMVLQPNFRGSSGKGNAFVTKGYGEWGRKMQTDLSDGVRYLVAQGRVDPAHVAIAGASYGGYAALAGVAQQSGIYNCAVSMSGMSDINNFMTDVLKSAGYNKGSRNYLYWKRYLGDESGWADISPLGHASAVTVPVLLLHGKDDTVVAIEQSYDMRDALKRAGKTVEMVLLEDEDHYLSKEPTRIQTLEAMMAFLLKYNPPG